jgi:para-nitrobenzyl esterase
MNSNWHSSDGANLDRRLFLGGSAAMAAGLWLVGGIASPAWAVDTGSSASPIGETAYGKIRGRMEGKINAFRGVPYGASTEGAARFLPPSKLQPWTGVRDALEVAPKAPQVRAAPLVAEYAPMDWDGPTSEDCLHLNLWTPGLNDNKKRPVMLWLHGGGYARSSANSDLYNGTHLASTHDVVVVGANHRLNILGYLYLAGTGDSRYANSSNVGMLDIVAALEWIRDNISNFGGDPNNVTLWGQSGGAGKVSTLMGMPAAKGLFHRAIVESGSATEAVSADDATKFAQQVLAKFNISASKVSDIANVPLDALEQLTLTRDGGRALAPVVDGRSLPAIPFSPVASELSANVPLLIGSNETEVTWNGNVDYTPPDDAALRDRVKKIAKINDGQADHLIAVYKKGWPKASNLDLALIIDSDYTFARPGIDLESERKAAQAKAPVYKYYFRWYTPVNGGRVRAMHTMELPFIYGNFEAAKTEVGDTATPEMRTLSDVMGLAWTTFARTGNPNHKGVPNWPAFESQKMAMMIFNTPASKALNDPYREQREVRNSFATQQSRL